MKQLLNALASKLVIVTEVKGFKADLALFFDEEMTLAPRLFNFEEVSDKTKELFVNLLQDDILEKLSDDGDLVEYSFTYGYIVGPNLNLSDIFIKLPLLDDGKFYGFKLNSSISFVRVDKNQSQNLIIAFNMSPWISEEFHNKQ